MENKKTKITSFTDLIAWREALRLALMVYKLTDAFLSREQYGLTSQIRRAAVSISSNIAEGFSRGTSKGKYQLYLMAYGSLAELQNQLLLSRDLKFCTKEMFDQVAKQSVAVAKLISGLKRIINSSSSTKYKIQDTKYQNEGG